MTDYREPAHLVRVETAHFHTDPNCPGHPWPDEHTEPDATYTVEHPQACKDQRAGCCCKDEPADVLHTLFAADSVFGCACNACRPRQPCTSCTDGEHEECLRRGPQCATEDWIHQYAEFEDLPTVPGSFQVSYRSWQCYEGDWDAELEVSAELLLHGPQPAYACSDAEQAGDLS